MLTWVPPWKHTLVERKTLNFAIVFFLTETSVLLAMKSTCLYFPLGHTEKYNINCIGARFSGHRILLAKEQQTSLPDTVKHSEI